MTTEELRESLLAAPKNGYATLTSQQREEMNAYCKRYSAFMDACTNGLGIFKRCYDEVV